MVFSYILLFLLQMKFLAILAQFGNLFFLLLLNEITEKHHVFQEQSNDLQINTPMKF